MTGCETEICIPLRPIWSGGKPCGLRGRSKAGFDADRSRLWCRTGRTLSFAGWSTVVSRLRCLLHASHASLSAVAMLLIAASS